MYFQDKVLEQLNIITEKLNQLEEAIKRNHEQQLEWQAADYSPLLFENNK